MKSFRCLVRLIAVCAGLLAGRSLAQDVSVSDPLWFLPGPAPEEMARPKSRLRPDYPDEMRKVGEPGYVIITRYVDAKAETRLMNAIGTHVSFQRAVEAEFPDWNFAPAKHAGQTVDARVWMAVIFNPRSAPAKGPDATPRLLSVLPVFVTGRPLDNDPSPVVRVKLSLDATGTVTAITPETELKPLVRIQVEEGVKTWRFAPARHDGKAVPAELVIAVICQPPIRANAGELVPPKVLHREPADFPVAMRGKGFRGRVMVGFTVTPEGKVENPVVTQSDNPGFDVAAIEALHKWKFAPGTRDGVPVKAKLSVTINFNSGPFNRDPQDAFAIESHGDQSKMPAELRFDTPPKPRGTVQAVYPYELLRDDITGKASAVFIIDERGHVGDIQVRDASRPEFGAALTAALDVFSFDPALRASKPTATALNMELRFERSSFSREGLVAPTSDDYDLLQFEQKHPERIANIKTIDAAPKPISQRAPVFPGALNGHVQHGEALIEFLIDREGVARLPRVVSASDPAFGYAGVQAIAQWRFEPMKAGGKAAVVRVRIPLSFVSKTPLAVFPEAPKAP